MLSKLSLCAHAYVLMCAHLCMWIWMHTCHGSWVSVLIFHLLGGKVSGLSATSIRLTGLQPFRESSVANFHFDMGSQMHDIGFMWNLGLWTLRSSHLLISLKLFLLSLYLNLSVSLLSAYSICSYYAWFSLLLRESIIINQFWTLFKYIALNKEEQAGAAVQVLRTHADLTQGTRFSYQHPHLCLLTSVPEDLTHSSLHGQFTYLIFRTFTCAYTYINKIILKGRRELFFCIEFIPMALTQH